MDEVGDRRCGGLRKSSEFLPAMIRIPDKMILSIEKYLIRENIGMIYFFLELLGSFSFFAIAGIASFVFCNQKGCHGMGFHILGGLLDVSPALWEYFFFGRFCFRCSFEKRTLQDDGVVIYCLLQDIVANGRMKTPLIV